MKLWTEQKSVILDVLGATEEKREMQKRLERMEREKRDALKEKEREMEKLREELNESKSIWDVESRKRRELVS